MKVVIFEPLFALRMSIFIFEYLKGYIALLGVQTFES